MCFCDPGYHLASDNRTCEGERSNYINRWEFNCCALEEDIPLGCSMRKRNALWKKNSLSMPNYSHWCIKHGQMMSIAQWRTSFRCFNFSGI